MILVIYNTHGHKLHFPFSKKAQFVTECGINCRGDPTGRLYNLFLEGSCHR